MVPVTVEFLVEGGGQVITREYQLPPMSRTTIVVDEIPGLESAAVSTKVRSTTRRADRRRTHDVVGRRRALRRAYGESERQARRIEWYFAEGAQGFFFTYLLLANPLAQANEATVRFLLEGGGEVVQTYPLTPLSRQTVSAGDVPELVGQSFGIEVTFAHGGVAERAMYFGTAAALDGRTRIRGRDGAVHDLVPRRRRDRAVLRNVHPAREPERDARRCDRALPSRERRARRQGGAGAGERARHDQYRAAG